MFLYKIQIIIFISFEEVTVAYINQENFQNKLFYTFPVVPYFGYPWGQNLCVVPSGELGACVPSKDCALRNGIPGGPCANGFGTCCVCKNSIFANLACQKLKLTFE